MREWTLRNREKVLARRAKWREQHREELAEKQRIYNIEKREEIAARRTAAYSLDKVREYRSRKPEIIRANGQRRRARIAGAPGHDYTKAEHIRGRWAMWGNRCRYCGAEASHTDHRIPLSRGGTHYPSNLVPACAKCNTSKHAKTEREFLAWA